MKLELWAVGEPKEPFAQLALAKYHRAITMLHPLEICYLKESKKGKGEERLQEESQRVLKALGPRDWLILFDERGRQMTSPQVAAHLSNALAQSAGRVIYLIGGSWGVNHQVKDRANDTLSFSLQVWPHELALVMAAECIYRSLSILKGTGYHHG